MEFITDIFSRVYDNKHAIFFSKHLYFRKLRRAFVFPFHLSSPAGNLLSSSGLFWSFGRKNRCVAFHEMRRHWSQSGFTPLSRSSCASTSIQHLDKLKASAELCRIFLGRGLFQATSARIANYQSWQIDPVARGYQLIV